MIPLPADFKEFLQLLNEHDVQYLLIGGYAVAYHTASGRYKDLNDLENLP